MSENQLENKQEVSEQEAGEQEAKHKSATRETGGWENPRHQTGDEPAYLELRRDRPTWLSFWRPMVKRKLKYVVLAHIYGETDEGKTINEDWLPELGIDEFHNGQQKIRIGDFREWPAGHYYICIYIFTIDDEEKKEYINTAEKEIFTGKKRRG